MTSPDAAPAPSTVLEWMVELGEALMGAGVPTYRVEELLTVVGSRHGYTADVFAVPTGLFVALRTREGMPAAMSMVRVREWSVDVARLKTLDCLLDDVAAGRVSIEAARASLQAGTLARSPWDADDVVLASMVASAGTAVYFGGRPVELVGAALGALALRVALLGLKQNPGVRYLESFAGGLVAGLVVLLAALSGVPHERQVLVLSVIIPILPGLPLTTGMAELAARNLVAGTARLMEALATFVSIILGLSLVLGLEPALGLSGGEAAAHEALAWPYQLAGLLAAGLGFAVLLGVPKENLVLSATAALLVWATQTVGRPLDGTYAAFLSAVVLAMAANVYARVRAKPAQVFLLPGLLLLVPGAFGYRSLEALLRGDYAAGAGQAVDMFLTGGALVIGLLVANVLVPPRRIL